MDPRKDNDGWIGVDLDGTLAHYDHFRGEDHVGAPVEEMVKKVNKWLAEGRDVRLFTARKPSPAVRRWMEEHLTKILPITATKDYKMQVLYDDRAVQVKRNTGKTAAEDEAQVWNK
jgi:hypothetical protein